MRYTNIQMYEAYPIILWLLLITVFCAIFTFHIIENKKVSLDLQKEYGSELVKKIIHFHWLHSIKLFSIIGLSFVIIALYDWQVREKTEQLEELQNIVNLNLNTEIEKQHETTIETAIYEQKDYYPPIIETNNQDEEAVSDHSTRNTIQDIFDAKKNTATDSRNSIDAIKTRYEELLVTYFLLQKCGKTTGSDYQLIISSLQKEIAASQAPIRLQYDTLTAAKGSYEELYSHNDCIKSDIESMVSQYDAYISSLLTNSKGN